MRSLAAKAAISDGADVEAVTKQVELALFLEGSIGAVQMNMCQQWFSIAGLLLDIVGFLLIAFEWRHMYVREREGRMYDLHHDYERSRAENRGEEYPDPRSGDYTMARLFSKLFTKEWRYRGRIFYSGVVLVILGFIGQTLGSWPGGVPFFGFKSC